MKFELAPNTPYSLFNASEYFGGWPKLDIAQPNIVMSFPVEGWQTSAAVALQQDNEGRLTAEVYGADEQAEKAWQQALAVLSLDLDDAAWVAVGQRDPTLARLQSSYNYLRPVLFHSPYEAAAAFIIGHRISIQQGRNIRQAMARQFGDEISVGTTKAYAFPRPQVLLGMNEFTGINSEKIERLHGVALAAMDGTLERAFLRSLPVEEALEKLRTIKGVGQFFSQGILFRGAGTTDGMTDDEVTKQAVQAAYKLPELPNQRSILQIAEPWRPYRSWATVLLHVWFRREAGGPHRQPRNR
jgi:DNA-3-methyladenine glycosylase II